MPGAPVPSQTPKPVTPKTSSSGSARKPTGDDRFLQDFVGDTKVAQPTKKAGDNPDEFLAEIAGEGAEANAVNKKASERLEQSSNEQNNNQAKTTQEAEKERKEQQEAAKEQQQQLNVLEKTVDSALSPLKNVADKVASLQTVGGIGLLLVILGILLFTVVQVNKQGDTRLKMLWYMLNGRATLEGSVNPQAAIQTKDMTQQEINNVSSNISQFVSDTSAVVAQSANTIAQNAVQNSATSFFGQLGNDFNQAFRNLP